MAPKPNPKDFMLMDRKGETITREPGTLQGYDFVIDGCEGCEIRLLDRTAQIQVDYCKDCKIVIGPVGGSVFARNCERCTFFVVCQQLRTRECVDCDVLVLIPGHPIVEMSRDIRFGALPRDYYSELELQLKETNLTIDKNHWDNIYDFSPDDPPGCTHFSLLTSSDVSKLLTTFPAQPSALAAPIVAPETIKDQRTDAQANDVVAETREVRVTAKRGAQFHANLCRSFLGGRPETAEKPALASNLRVILSGAGAAVGTAAEAALLLEREGLARIICVSTGMTETEKSKEPSDLPLREVERASPTIRIELERLGA